MTMLHTICLVATAVTFPAPDLGVFEIESVTRREAFAGRLGKRVKTSMEVTSEGKTYTVHVDGATHTWVGGRRLPRLDIGTSVALTGRQNGQTIRVTWDGIANR